MTVRSTARWGGGRSGIVIGSAGSRGCRGCGGVLGFERCLGQQTPEAACEVALEAAKRAFAGLALGLLAGQVLAGGGVALGAGDRDRVQRPVELAVSAAVQSVLCLLPGGAGDRGGAGLAAEAGVGAEALGAGGASDQQSGGQRAAPLLLKQLRSIGADLREQL